MKNMTSFPWQELQINNILVTFSLLSIYASKFLTWQFFLVKEKLARQIFLDKENLSTIPHLHEQFFLVKETLSRKNCSCKWVLFTYFLHLNCLFVCYSPFLVPLFVRVCFLSFFLLQVLSLSSFLNRCLTLYGFHSFAGLMCFPCQSSRRC